MSKSLTPNPFVIESNQVAIAKLNTICTLKSQVTQSSPEIAKIDLQNTIKEFINGQEYQLMVHQTHAVAVGKTEKGILTLAQGKNLNFEEILEIRIFNQERELYALRTSGLSFGYRIREDQFLAPSDLEVYVEMHKMVGTVAENQVDSNWSRVREPQQGINVALPFAVRSEEFYNSKDPDVGEKEHSPNLFIGVINYLDYDQNGVMRGKDDRLCGFFSFNKQNKHLEVVW